MQQTQAPVRPRYSLVRLGLGDRATMVPLRLGPRWQTATGGTSSVHTRRPVCEIEVPSCPAHPIVRFRLHRHFRRSNRRNSGIPQCSLRLRRRIPARCRTVAHWDQHWRRAVDDLWIRWRQRRSPELKTQKTHATITYTHELFAACAPTTYQLWTTHTAANDVTGARREYHGRQEWNLLWIYSTKLNFQSKFTIKSESKDQKHQLDSTRCNRLWRNRRKLQVRKKEIIHILSWRLRQETNSTNPRWRGHLTRYFAMWLRRNHRTRISTFFRKADPIPAPLKASANSRPHHHYILENLSSSLSPNASNISLRAVASIKK